MLVEIFWSTMAVTSFPSAGSMLCLYSGQTILFSMTDFKKGKNEILNNHFYEPLSLCRGYSANKISQNVQCEIFQTILEEARESYNGSIVHELTSNLPEDLEQNIDVICQFFTEFCQRYYA